MTDNPYASSLAEEHELAPSPIVARELRYYDVGREVVEWEKLRILYNLVLALAATGAMALHGNVLSLSQLLPMMIVCCIGANACFTAGPAVSGYVTWFFGRQPLVRHILFLGGTCVAMCLAAAIILSA